VDLAERLMMMVSFSSFLVNGLPAVQSDAKGGRRSAFRRGLEKSERIGSPISRSLKVPATSAPPGISMLDRVTIIFARQAAIAGVGLRAAKYASSGVV
jgi:hypothetical protein